MKGEKAKRKGVDELESEEDERKEKGPTSLFRPPKRRREGNLPIPQSLGESKSDPRLLVASSTKI